VKNPLSELTLRELKRKIERLKDYFENSKRRLGEGLRGYLRFKN
jgi:hypothetical protein